MRLRVSVNLNRLFLFLEKGDPGSPSCRGDEKGVSFLDRLGFPEKYSTNIRTL